MILGGKFVFPKLVLKCEQAYIGSTRYFPISTTWARQNTGNIGIQDTKCHPPWFKGEVSINNDILLLVKST